MVKATRGVSNDVAYMMSMSTGKKQSNALRTLNAKHTVGYNNNMLYEEDGLGPLNVAA